MYPIPTPFELHPTIQLSPPTLGVQTESGEMYSELKTEHSNKELYWIIVQFIPVQMISC